MRPIDADALTDELIKGIEADTGKSVQTTFTKSVCMILCKAIEQQPTIDAIPVSFIQELIERGKQLIEEYRGKPDYGIIVDGLIERVVNYEVLIEKWREKNGTDVD